MIKAVEIYLLSRIFEIKEELIRDKSKIGVMK
jgi:hypothetical protein